MVVVFLFCFFFAIHPLLFTTLKSIKNWKTRLYSIVSFSQAASPLFVLKKKKKKEVIL